MVLVAKFGAEGPWFILSDMFLLERPTEIALRVRHGVNGTGFYPGDKSHWKNAPSMFFAGPPAVMYRMDATGRDGKRYPKAIRWDLEKSVFRGQGTLWDQGMQIYEVDEKSSKRFVATDLPLRRTK